MISINIDIRQSPVFQKYKDVLPRIITRSLNYAGGVTRTAISNTVRDKYAMKKSDFDSTLKVSKASDNKQIYSLFTNRKSIALPKFHISWTKRMAGASVEIVRGRKRIIAHTFIATMKTGHRGVFIRRLSKRLPIRELKGPAASLLLTSARVTDVVMPNVPPLFEKELFRLIDFELSKVKDVE